MCSCRDALAYILVPGIFIKAPLMAMGKKHSGCASKIDSKEPVVVIGSSSVMLKTEVSLLQLWDKSIAFSADDCAYTTEITSTCGDKSKAAKHVCPGKFASNLMKTSRLLSEADDSSPLSSENNSSSVLQFFGLSDSETFSSTSPTSVCTRISEAACEGVWRHRVYNSEKQIIGQSLIFVGGESWGIPSDRSIIGDLDQASVSVLLEAFKVIEQFYLDANAAANLVSLLSSRQFGVYLGTLLTKLVRPVGWKRSTAYAVPLHDVVA